MEDDYISISICPRQYPRERQASMLPEEWERTFSAAGLRAEVTYRELLPLELLLAEDVTGTSSRDIYDLAGRLKDELRKVYGLWGSHKYLRERQQLLHQQAAAEDTRLRRLYDAYCATEDCSQRQVTHMDVYRIIPQHPAPLASDEELLTRVSATAAAPKEHDAWDSLAIMKAQAADARRIELRDTMIYSFVGGMAAGLALMMCIISWNGGSFSGNSNPTSLDECVHADTMSTSTDAELGEAMRLCRSMFPRG